MLFARKAVYASTIFAMLSFALMLSAPDARADAIAITSGFASIGSPFTPPNYVSSSFDLRGDSFRAAGGAGDAHAGSVHSSCAYPCLQGATFSVNSGIALQVSTLAVLTLDGQTRAGRFDGSVLGFETGPVTIPLDAGPELTLTTTFSMRGLVDFQGIDPQNGGSTGFTFSTDVYGSGIATFSLVFSSIITHEYEIRRARYDFQPVPEPAALLLLGTGLAGLVGRYRRRAKALIAMRLAQSEDRARE